MPESPAVAGGQSLDERADLVDRADRGSRGERPVGPNNRAMAAPGVGELFARARQPCFDDAEEGDARLAAPGRRGRDGLVGKRLDGIDSLARSLRVGRIALDADEGAARRRATTPVVPEPKNGSSTRSPALEAATSTRVSSASGFCVG